MMEKVRKGALMNEKLMKYIISYKKAMIPLLELESLFSEKIDYKEFAMHVQALVEDGLLEPVHRHGTNHKTLPLFNTYRIIRRKLKKTLNDAIQQMSLQVHPKIKLNAYFALNETEWIKDLPYIMRIDKYLKENGLPQSETYSPERSLQLMWDEKWIDEKGGRKLLERMEIWELCRICNAPDPLMISVNPLRIHKERHRHLIVENKTTYYLLTEILKETCFTSLIYGSGWKIVSNISMAAQQMGLLDKEHEFYYFGDIDLEGISIWYSLYERYEVGLALPFYRALLQKNNFTGKETHYRNEEALAMFSQLFSTLEQEKLKALFDQMGYYPQEALNRLELQDIWRNFHGNCF